MARVEVTVEESAPETPITTVLGIPKQFDGPSVRGSTYWSRLLTCPREARLAELLSPLKIDIALSTGFAWHLSLEMYYDALLRKCTVEDAQAAAVKAVEPLKTAQGYSAMYETIMRMLVGYFREYASEPEEYEVLAVEETLGVSEPMEYTARLDTFMRHRSRGTLHPLEHKCLPADVEVVDASTGDLTTIGALAVAGVKWRVQAYDTSARKLVWTEADAPHPVGVRDIYELRLANGRRLRASDNHPIYTQRGWVPVAALREDDHVASPAETGGDCEAARATDPVIAELIGYFLGDGTMRSARFTKKPGPVLDRVIDLLFQTGCNTTTRTDPRSGAVTVSAGAPMSAILKDAGIDRCRAAEKFIPKLYRRTTHKSAGALLGALWSTDGCIDVFEEHRDGKTQQKVRMAYTSRSEQLAMDVQGLLLQFGVDSSVTGSTVAYKGERRPYWQVKIVGRDNKRRFIRLLIDRVVPAVKYTEAYLCSVFDKIKPGPDPKLYTDPQHPELVWSRVKSLIISGREMTYDVTVPGTANFVAQDILTHNSAKQLNAAILEGYQLALQITGQGYLAARSVDEKQIGGVLSHVIVSVSTKQVTPQFRRVNVLTSPEHLEAFETAMTSWQALRAHVERLGYPANFSACAGYARGYSKCRYYSLCYAQPNLNLGRVEELVHRVLEMKTPEEQAEALPHGFVPVTALTRYVEDRGGV